MECKGLSTYEKGDNPMINRFFEDRKDCFDKGTKAEQIVYRYLRDKRDLNLINVTKDKKYQDIDVDFLLDYKNRTFYVEVKTDYKISQTKRFLLEYNTYKDDKVWRGWMDKSKTNYLIWYSFELNTMFILDFRKLKAWADTQPKKRIKNPRENCPMDAVFIDISKCKELGILKETIENVS